MTTINERISIIQSRIHEAVLKSPWPDSDVELIAVSKRFSPDDIRNAAKAGIKIFGESYLQEAKEKISQLLDLHVQWHFVGHLQRNKAKEAVRLFDLIHSVDSIALGEELNKQAENIGKLQKILIQVNLGAEPQKSGISPTDLVALLLRLSDLPHIKIQGLMTIPPICETPEKAKIYFHHLRKVADQIHKLNLSNVSMRELSMGMSEDFEEAILEGATYVRIGTAIFGERI